MYHKVDHASTDKVVENTKAIYGTIRTRERGNRLSNDTNNLRNLEERLKTHLLLATQTAQ